MIKLYRFYDHLIGTFRRTSKGVVIRLVLLGLVVSASAFITQDKLGFREAFVGRTSSAETIKINTVTLAEAIQWFYNTNSVWIDVRDPVYFRYAHIRRAINVPFGNVDAVDPGLLKRLKEAPVFVVYCNNTGCGLSYRAASEFYRRGFVNVTVYSGGWEEWHSSRLPIETSSGLENVGEDK